MVHIPAFTKENPVLLITELTHDINSSIVESSDGKGKRLYIEGKMVVTEQVNKNNRYYSKSIMEPVIERYINEKVKTGTAYGELDHPQGPKINPERISHLIESVSWQGNDITGKAVVNRKGLGEIVYGIIEMGGKVGCSTRGMGSVKDNGKGIMEVQNDYKLATIADIVTDPSGPGCFVNGIMEGVDWVYDARKDFWFQNKLEQIVDNTKELMNNEAKRLNEEELLERKIRLFQHYLDILVQK